jgi:glycosyltransferase involved in cell wall biosynthesis
VTFLIIQIPCYNEERSLPITLADLPTEIPGIDRIEWQIIDDGCLDRTVEIAQAQGVHHIVRMGHNRGLAAAFMAGLHNAVKLGADIIVNTDADNQYCGADIARLVEPIIGGAADIVVGARPIATTAHISWIKKQLQHVGSAIVRIVAGTDVVDATSGFRAFTRSAAKRLAVYNQYTYTLETLIQAGQQNMRVVSVPIRTNGDLRPSRLVRSIPDYVLRSSITIIRTFTIYRPMRLFLGISLLAFLPGLVLLLRFLVLSLMGFGNGHVQSLQLGTMLVGVSVVTLVAGILADLVSVTRRQLETLRQDIFDLKETLAEIDKPSAKHPTGPDND